MNFLDQLHPASREARLRYLDADFQVLQQGEFVRCAVSGDPIRLDNLRYRNVERQVPFASAEAAFSELLKRIRYSGS